VRRWFLLLAVFLVLLCAPRAHAQLQVPGFAADPPTCDNTRGLIYWNTVTLQFKSCGPTVNTWTAFGTGGGGGTPGGANTDVQYNNSGTFGGDAFFTYTASGGPLTIRNATCGLTVIALFSACGTGFGGTNYGGFPALAEFIGNTFTPWNWVITNAQAPGNSGTTRQSFIGISQGTDGSVVLQQYLSNSVINDILFDNNEGIFFQTFNGISTTLGAAGVDELGDIQFLPCSGCSIQGLSAAPLTAGKPLAEFEVSNATSSPLGVFNILGADNGGTTCLPGEGAPCILYITQETDNPNTIVMRSQAASDPEQAGFLDNLSSGLEVGQENTTEEDDTTYNPNGTIDFHTYGAGGATLALHLDNVQAATFGGQIKWTSNTAGGIGTCSPPATNGVYQYLYNVTAAAAVPPTCPEVGLTPDQAAGATVLYSDNNGVIYDPAVAMSLPTPTTLGNPNFFTTFINNGPASTITPVTWTISVNGGTAGARAIIGKNQKCSLVIDQVASTQWDLDCVTIGAALTGAQVFYAVDYGVLADAQVNWAPSWSSGSNIITCATCNFNTTARVGQIIFGTNVAPFGYTSQLTSVVQLPQTTIQSIDSNTQIHTVGNATASWTVGPLIWGDDDTTALQNAWTAAETACGILYLPGAKSLTQKGLFTTAPTTQCTSATGAIRAGPGVFGAGMGTSIIIATPNFDPTTCTGPNGAGAYCFLLAAPTGSNPGGTQIMNWNIWGGGNSALTGFSGKIAMGLGANSSALNFTISGWGAATTGFTGFLANWAPVTLTNFEVDGVGTTACVIGTGSAVMATVNMSFSFCGDNGGNGTPSNNGPAVDIQNGATLLSTGNLFLPVPAGQCGVEADSGGIFLSTNDIIGNADDAATSAGLCATGGTVSIQNDRIVDNASGSTQGLKITSGGIVRSSQTTYSATGGSGIAISNASGGFFYDNCGNTASGTTIYSGAGTVYNCNNNPINAKCLITSGAGPLACGSASQGKVAIPTTTASYTINTTAVHTGSTITITPTTDNTGIPGTPTCVLPTITAIPSISARTAGTSFTIAETSTTGITCYDWMINN
jgi:hypothetical protein